MTNDNVEQRYQGGAYLEYNPDWHRGDSPWKALLVHAVLKDFKLEPSSICEVGCGTGEVLANLKQFYRNSELAGYDISPDAAQFWKAPELQGIRFFWGDFSVLNQQHYDCILLLDVIEHLTNPFDFLTAIKEMAEYYVFHFPLDLSVSTVLREKPLLNGREKLGHIHYFTKGPPLALLRESGFEVMQHRYTNASLSGPDKSWRSHIAAIPRLLAYLVNKDFGVRLLGGETLLVLAKAAKNKTPNLR